MPNLIDVRYSYSVGAKVNIGNYESVDVFFSETHGFDPVGLTPEETTDFIEESRNQLIERLDSKLSDIVTTLREDKVAALDHSPYS